MANSTNSTNSPTLRRHQDGTLINGAARKRRASRRAQRRLAQHPLEVLEMDLYREPATPDTTRELGSEPQFHALEGVEAPAFVTPRWATKVWKVLTYRVW